MQSNKKSILDNFTSTGAKFWHHQSQMLSFKEGASNTIISTHVSPESMCNLKCSYCSVDNRDTSKSIKLNTIKDYIVKLQTRGLKSVIITGGGEPTLYRQINELVQWIKHERNLEVALITNGLGFSKLDSKTIKAFSWIRVSINTFDGWEKRIGKNFNSNVVDADCVIGCSMILETENVLTEKNKKEYTALLNKVANLADRMHAKYIRMLPNCRLGEAEIDTKHKILDLILNDLDDDRFFHQYKNHKVPKEVVCHQSYFRPYLSEVPYKGTIEPGSVYPCDSVVLNKTYQHFANEYQLCKPEDVLDFVDRKPNITCTNPTLQCGGCVFTDNIEMLGRWKRNTLEYQSVSSQLKHKNFV